MAINFRNTTFLLSAPSIRQCPADEGIEIAFAGRSNAGKSSALNTLTDQNIARTSKTPGRTQLINHFTLNENQRLVDLPGYGYAKVSHKIREQWQQHLSEYLQERKSLKGLVLLTDIRHPLQASDQQMLSWAKQAQLPVHLLLTKADKLKSGAGKSVLLAVQKQLQENDWDASVQLFSSLKKTGLDQLQKRLDVLFSHSEHPSSAFAQTH